MIDKLQEDMKNAQKSKDVLKLSTIRLIRSSVSYSQIEKGRELTDDEVLAVITKEAKQRRESIEAARNVGRNDIAEQESAELDILKQYLPEQLSEAEVEAIVREVVAEVGAADLKDRGKVMGPIMQKTRGRADGRMVGQIVERVLRG
ncbi:MAG: GatB/YqeY domain-containing protein [Armatimonadetes bacterium]|nr:GatB/YqeY domain-containing protein [Armatimonadota bacterium]